MDTTIMPDTQTVPDAVAVTRIAQQLANLQHTANSVGLHIDMGIHGLPAELLTAIAAPAAAQEFPATPSSGAFLCHRQKVGVHTIPLFAWCPDEPADVEDAA